MGALDELEQADIGALAWAIKEKSGATNKQLAETLNFSASTISRYIKLSAEGPMREAALSAIEDITDNDEAAEKVTDNNRGPSEKPDEKATKTATEPSKPLSERFEVGKVYNKVPLSELLVVEGLQLDARGIDADTVKQYMSVILAHREQFGKTQELPFPPVQGFIVEGYDELVLGDGHQRYFAYTQAMEGFIPVTIEEGDIQDIQIRIALANRDHGKQLSPKARKEAIERIISMTDYSDKKIALLYGVSGQTVGRYRKAMIEAGEIDENRQRQVMRGGEQYTIKIGDTRTKAQREKAKAKAQTDALQDEITKELAAIDKRLAVILSSKDVTEQQMAEMKGIHGRISRVMTQAGATQNLTKEFQRARAMDTAVKQFMVSKARADAMASDDVSVRRVVEADKVVREISDTIELTISMFGQISQKTARNADVLAGSTLPATMEAIAANLDNLLDQRELTAQLTKAVTTAKDCTAEQMDDFNAILSTVKRLSVSILASISQAEEAYDLRMQLITKQSATANNADDLDAITEAVAELDRLEDKAAVDAETGKQIGTIASGQMIEKATGTTEDIHLLKNSDRESVRREEQMRAQAKARESEVRMQDGLRSFEAWKEKQNNDAITDVATFETEVAAILITEMGEALTWIRPLLLIRTNDQDGSEKPIEARQGESESSYYARWYAQKLTAPIRKVNITKARLAVVREDWKHATGKGSATKRFKAYCLQLKDGVQLDMWLNKERMSLRTQYDVSKAVEMAELTDAEETNKNEILSILKPFLTTDSKSFGDMAKKYNLGQENLPF
jgi:hypothetical protein